MSHPAWEAELPPYVQVSSGDSPSRLPAGFFHNLIIGLAYLAYLEFIYHQTFDQLCGHAYSNDDLCMSRFDSCTVLACCALFSGPRSSTSASAATTRPTSGTWMNSARTSRVDCQARALASSFFSPYDLGPRYKILLYAKNRPRCKASSPLWLSKKSESWCDRACRPHLRPSAWAEPPPSLYWVD